MIRNFLLDLLFPKFCFSCQREGSYLCKDCKATLDILRSHQKYNTEHLKDLYWALPYQNPLVKNLIGKFKYKPFVRSLSKPLSLLIINHFQLIENPPSFLGGGSEFILIPVPLEKRRLKWRGFNQAEELAKELSKFLKIPMVGNCLLKIKNTFPQVELSEEEREKNVLGAFLVKNKNGIKGKKILLVDDIFTTGSTLKECARVLKESGAREVVGVVIARG